MDDTLGVRRLERIGDLDGVIQQLVEFQRLLGDPVLQGLPFQVLHDEEGRAFPLADVMQGADVGMVQGGGGAGLALEALESLTVRRVPFGEELQGDGATEPSVLGLVDDAHAPAAKLLKNPVVGNRPADHGGAPSGFSIQE